MAKTGTTNATRRDFLRVGLGALSGLTLPGLIRARAAAKDGPAKSDTAVILVWLRGGCSHLDTFDPKPDAPSEYRGPFSPIDCATPGIRVTELIPQIAALSNRYALLRSVAHQSGGHPAGSLAVLAGDPAKADKLKPVYPDWMSIVNYLRRDPNRELPNYIAVNPVDRYDSFTIAGSTYLGPAYEPFKVTGDPSHPQFQVPNIRVDQQQNSRLQGRITLKGRLDRLDAVIDSTGVMQANDAYEAQAMRLLTSPAATAAFDLTREKTSVRERYGMHQWGQQCLMARRLVEAGVDVVATEFDGPLCGRVANWDDHAVNHHVFDALQFRAPYFDQAVSALINDLYERGLDRRVLVLVTGEFGRTPRISHVASSGGGVASGPKGAVQPGRDHWPRANTMLFAGGGIPGGQVIGATDPRGEDPVDRRVGPSDILATIYRHLGIDYQHVAIPNFAGRPIPIVLGDGVPVPELCSAST